MFLPGVLKIHALCPDQGECVKLHIPFCCDLVVELAHGTAAKVPGIFVTGIHILDLFVDLFKVRIGDNGLPAKDQLTFVGDLKGNVLENPGVVGDNFTHHTVSPGNCL